MAFHSSEKNWKWIESLNPQRQKEILQWQLQAREPIRSFADIRLGDHLVTKGALPGLCDYEHHCLCVDFDEEQEKDRSPIIIHYFNTPANAFSQIFTTASFCSGASLGKAGKIQETTLKKKNDLINEDKLQGKDDYEWAMARVVWPDELRRYSVPEIIMNSEKRKDENSYHLAKNNCESFVMWCLCGLNISLQVTPARRSLFELLDGFLRTPWILHAIQIPKVIPDLINFVGAANGRSNVATVGLQAQKVSLLKALGVVAIFTVQVEAIVGGYDIYTAVKMWNSRVTKSKEKLIKEVDDIVLSRLFHSGGTITGMFVGQLMIPNHPVLGGLVGAVSGFLGGHAIEKFRSEIRTETFVPAPIIEDIIEYFQQLICLIHQIYQVSEKTLLI